MKTLVADIGGTNSRLAVAITSRKGSKIELIKVVKFKNSDFKNFEEIIKKYLTTKDGIEINRMCVAAVSYTHLTLPTTPYV